MLAVPVGTGGFRTGVVFGATALLLIAFGWYRGAREVAASAPSVSRDGAPDVALHEDSTRRDAAATTLIAATAVAAILAGAGPAPATALVLLAALVATALRLPPRWSFLAATAVALVMPITSALAWPARLTVAAVAMGAGIGIAHAGDPARFGRLAPAALAVSAGGIYATVPEPAAAAPLLGALLPLALVPVRLTAALAPAAAAVLGWAASGAAARSTAMVGAVGSLGLLALTWVKGPWRTPPVRPLAAHLLAVLVASRVAGLRDRTAVAVAIAVVGAAVALLLVRQRAGVPIEHRTGSDV